ncbi:hypothetical protein ACOI22_03960 [Glaciecola sp. 2405UD65-10]|uniref:hypothetical protein n=1 Tax=Glaciecola sp. 2405UD65-10 TaxID=3397244 RepID=UPI003B5BA356
MQELKFEQVEDVNGGANPGTRRRDRRSTIGSNPISATDVAMAGAAIAAAGQGVSKIPHGAAKAVGGAMIGVGGAMQMAAAADHFSE